MLKEGGDARLAPFFRGQLVPKLTALVVLVGLIRIALYPAHVQHDVALYLQTGQLLLRGQRPYKDFIDLNPPLIMYLSAIPAAVAAALRTSIAPTALFMTACAASASIVATRRTLVRAFEEAEDDTLLAEVAVLALAYALFVGDLAERLDLPYPGNPSPDPRLSAFFGQREHLFLIAALPFVALRFRRWGGGKPPLWGAVVAGALAALGTCLKPQFVLVLLPLEARQLTAKRRLSLLFSPELVSFLAVALAYAAHFALLPGAIRSAWFERWLPFVLDGYGVFDEPSWWTLVLRCWPSLLAVVLAFGMSLKGDKSGQRLIRTFASMALAGAVLYVAQRKGWTYHAYPEKSCALVVAACWIAGARAVGASGEDGEARFIIPISRQRLVQSAGAMVALAAFACAVCVARIDTPRDVDDLRRSSQVMRTISSLTSKGDPVLVASTSVWDPYPALTLLDRLPGSRYLWLFPIPMLQRIEPSGGTAEDCFVGELAEDIRSRRPKLLLLSTGRCFGCKKTSVAAFFHDHEPLASALEDYSLRGTVRDGQEFEVLVRVETPR